MQSKGLSRVLQHHSSKASILWRSAFFTVQLSHPYMTTGKTIALTKWTFIGKIRLKLKTVGKTTRPFMYDLNQTPYNHTVKVGNRFKGCSLIDCLMNYGWRFMTLYRKQGSRPSPRERNAKSKMAV